MKLKASFDDGVKEDLILSELMQTYAIETIFYFPSKPEVVNEPFGRTSLTRQERQVISKNHEIGSHTVSHPLLTRISINKAISEINMSRQYLQLEFGQSIDSFCYPRGYANPELMLYVQEAGYTNARGVTVGYLDKPENPYYEQTTVHVGCDRKEYGGLDWFSYALKMLDIATKDSVFHLWGHGWEIAKDVHNFDKLNRLCKELVKARS
jgi:peptidoglycan/xylan/chitin deacetylase (PgdA/CDA1 family)